MNTILLYIGGGALAVHGFIHLLATKFSLGEMKADEQARRTLFGQWAAAGVGEMTLGSLMVLMLAYAESQKAVILSGGMATLLSFFLAGVSFLAFRGRTEMPERIAHFIYLAIALCLALGVFMS